MDKPKTPTNKFGKSSEHKPWNMSETGSTTYLTQKQHSTDAQIQQEKELRSKSLTNSTHDSIANESHHQFILKDSSTSTKTNNS